MGFKMSQPCNCVKYNPAVEGFWEEELMIKYERNSHSDSMLRALSTMICIGVNVGLSFAACGLGLPVFLDTLL